MTAIAWDGKTLSADRMLSFGNSNMASVTKIHNIFGLLCGWAGDASNGRECIEWVRNGRKPDEFPQCQRNANSGSLMVIEREYGKVKILNYYTSPYPVLIEDSFHAIGSGDEFALAVMYLGESSKRAIEVATALCPTVGNGIDTLEF